MAKKLYLIPSLLSEEAGSSISRQIVEAVSQLKHFMVENERSARRFIKKISPSVEISSLVFFELSEHTSMADARKFFSSVKEDMGIISEAGCPCVADPGSDIVNFAHEQGVQVIPLVGPSSILLALMASGLNGQNFAFVGYLAKDEVDRRKQIKFLEKRSALENQTQIFMETPYRQEKVFNEIIELCQPSTLLSVAVNLTAPNEFIKTCTVKEWGNQKPDFHKNPGLFLIHSTSKL